MNELIELMKTRRSCRAYKPEMPPKELIEQVCEAGTYAPSGMNRQPSRIIAVTDPALRDKLSDMNRRIMGKDEGFDPFYGAPVILIVVADKSFTTYIYDGSVVMENLMLAAHALGLGSCWIHRAKEEFETEEGREILRALGLDENYVGIGNCALGYSAQDLSHIPARKDGYVVFA